MTRRYYVPDLPLSGGIVSLPDEEVPHAIKVMRVRVGDEITVFDGRGNESIASVTEVGRHSCQCQAIAAQRIDREPERVLRMGIALPKPDRSRELIERLTELGVRSVTPLVADRTQRAASDSMIEKLRRTVVEACKQCGRNRLMQIAAPVSAEQFFESAEHPPSKWIAHPTSRQRPWGRTGAGVEATVAIGPEGGWTEAEVATATACGFCPIDLGKRIYRVETAATVVAAVLSLSPEDPGD